MSFVKAEKEWYDREPKDPCRWHPPTEDHPGYESDNCPECYDAYEASLPDNQKEADGIA